MRIYWFDLNRSLCLYFVHLFLLFADLLWKWQCRPFICRVLIGCLIVARVIFRLLVYRVLSVYASQLDYIFIISTTLVCGSNRTETISNRRAKKYKICRGAEGKKYIIINSINSSNNHGSISSNSTSDDGTNHSTTIFDLLRLVVVLLLLVSTLVGICKHNNTLCSLCWQLNTMNKFCFLNLVFSYT